MSAIPDFLHLPVRGSSRGRTVVIEEPQESVLLCPNRLKRLLAEAAVSGAGPKVRIPTAGELHSRPAGDSTFVPLGTKGNDAPVILCIGTDRMIGDSLGPLTGSLLKKHAGDRLQIYGTLQNTVNACNLTDTLAQIKKKQPHSTVIAVDASLGQSGRIGSVFIRPGSLKPGAGVSKELPAAGDISITGITGEQGKQPWLSLQTARLSIVMDMAEQICKCILSVCS